MAAWKPIFSQILKAHQTGLKATWGGALSRLAFSGDNRFIVEITLH
jgi:hypothetical protein